MHDIQTAVREIRDVGYSQSWLRQVEGPYLGLTTDEVEELREPLRAIV